jgi:hypothetical protein
LEPKNSKGIKMHSIIINVQDNVLDKIIHILKNISGIEIVERVEKKNSATDERWSYWREEELDNFGKISIGLSKHDYDDEDYSKW